MSFQNKVAWNDIYDVKMVIKTYLYKLMYTYIYS
jgi:hypothetical protein